MAEKEKKQEIIIIKKKGGGHGGAHGGAWKVAYADFVTAMMAFFLVMWLMGSDEETKTSVAAYFNMPLSAGNWMPRLFDGSQFQSPVHPNEVAMPPPPAEGPEEEGDEGASGRGANDEETKKFLEIKKEIYEMLQEKRMLDDVEVTRDERGIVIRVNNKIFFRAGSAKLVEAAKPILDKVLEILKATDFFVEIGGHTDNSSIETEQFPSNWELSAARAISVQRYFLFYGLKTNRMRAVGYADSKPLSQLDNGKQQLSPAHSRRVEFILMENEASLKH